MDYSFSEAEKRFVVAEMIKASQIDLESIVAFYKQQGVQPDWYSMQIPSGRNIYQCVEAARSLGIRVDQPSNPLLHAQHGASLKRKSPTDFDAPGPKRPAIAPSLEPAPTAAPYTRIQPRPPHNGYTGITTSQSPQVTPTGTGRKRGRPSKADREAQARANAPSSFAPISPAPPAPTMPHFAPQDHGAVASAPAYRTSPGPSDFAPRRGSRPLSVDSTQPRGLPPFPTTAYDPVERSPAPPERRLSPMEPAIDNPAVHEVGRRLGPRDRVPSDHRPKDSGPSQATAAEQMKKESPKAINMPA